MIGTPTEISVIISNHPSWWIGGLLTAATLSAAAEPIAPLNPDAAIRVRLYVYAGVSPVTLAAAKNTAAQILQRAGVRSTWAECRIREDDPLKDPACGLPVTAMDLQLRILDSEMARRAGPTRHSFGYALVADGFSSIAAAYYYRVLELENTNLADRAPILGCIMAHEIGHLLLGRFSHSRSGIMRAFWDGEDLKKVARGRMWFTAAESARMISMVARRRQARAAGSIERLSQSAAGLSHE